MAAPVTLPVVLLPWRTVVSTAVAPSASVIPASSVLATLMTTVASSGVVSTAAAASHGNGLSALPLRPEHARPTPAVLPSGPATAPAPFFGGRGRALAQLGHQRHVLFVNVGVVSPLSAFVSASESVAGPLSGTVFGRMTHSSARGAHYVVGDVGAILALPALVVVGSAVAASRAVSLSESSVEQGQLSQLVPPQVVLTLGYVDSLLDNLIDLCHGLLD